MKYFKQTKIVLKCSKCSNYCEFPMYACLKYFSSSYLREKNVFVANIIQILIFMIKLIFQSIKLKKEEQLNFNEQPRKLSVKEFLPMNISFRQYGVRSSIKSF